MDVVNVGRVGGWRSDRPRSRTRASYISGPAGGSDTCDDCILRKLFGTDARGLPVEKVMRLTFIRKYSHMTGADVVQCAGSRAEMRCRCSRGVAGGLSIDRSRCFCRRRKSRLRQGKRIFFRQEKTKIKKALRIVAVRDESGACVGRGAVDENGPLPHDFLPVVVLRCTVQSWTRPGRRVNPYLVWIPCRL